MLEMVTTMFVLGALMTPLQPGGEVEPPRPGGSVQWVYRDVVSGEFRAPPPEVARALQHRAVALRRRPVALREAPVSAPGGGVRVDLRARFHAYLRARRDATGTLVVECATADPPGATGASYPGASSEEE
jgi:hypothetical protein